MTCEEVSFFKKNMVVLLFNNLLSSSVIDLTHLFYFFFYQLNCDTGQFEFRHFKIQKVTDNAVQVQNCWLGLLLRVYDFKSLLCSVLAVIKNCSTLCGCFSCCTRANSQTRVQSPWRQKSIITWCNCVVCNHIFQNPYRTHIKIS